MDQNEEAAAVIAEAAGVIVHNITFRHSPQLDQFFGALAVAQLSMTKAKKDRRVQFETEKSKQNYTYADLESVMDACRQQLNENGISIIQPPTGGTIQKMILTDDKGSPYEELYVSTVVTTILGHKSGQWMASDLELSSTEISPKALGKIVTYGRRYGLQSMAGVASEDDDSAPALSSGPGAKRTTDTGRSAPQQQTDDPKTAMFKHMKDIASALDVLSDLKAQLFEQRGDDQGEMVYRAHLDKHGVKKANEFKTVEKMRACAGQILDDIKNYKGETINADFAALGTDVNKPLDPADHPELTKMLERTKTLAESLKLAGEIEAKWIEKTGDKGGYFAVCKRHGVTNAATFQAQTIDQRGQLFRDLFHTLRQAEQQILEQPEKAEKSHA